LCLVLACFSLCASFCFAGEQEWVEVRSPNFSVMTDAGEKKGREVALHFEQMRSVFGTLMEKAEVNLSVPLQIVAFRNTKEIRQVAPLFNGKPTEIAGLFQGGEDRSFIMLDMSADNAWNAVFHEYAHRLMDGNLSSHPDPWLEEGFAEYFSSIEVDNKEARVGKIPDETFLILRQLGWMRVSDLLRVQQNTKTYNESGDHRTTFYAESSLLVHYLYDKKLLTNMSVYFQALREQKKSIDQSLQAALGMTAEQLDAVLRGYLRTGQYRYYRLPTPAGIVAAQFTLAPMSAADGRAIVAAIHAHGMDYQDKVIAEFEEVLKADPQNELALQGAGFACLRHGELDQASDYLRRAEQRNDKDPLVHYYYAMVLSRQGPRDGESSAEIKKELEAAIALDPKMADAYSLLGAAQATSGESEKAIATLTKAVKLAPANDRYLFNLGNAYLANLKPDYAIQIFRSLQSSVYPGLAMQANLALAQAANFKGQMKSFNSGNSRAGNAKVEVRDEKTGEWVEERADATDGKAEPAKDATEQEQVVQLPSGPPLRFLKGKLIAVDCSAAPQAVMTVNSGAKSVKVHVQDSGHIVLIGADKFSCDWKDKSVSVNYHDRADGDGDAVSVEMQ
jgi:cytochrome c-type biogenesis protein CcmH/NrfG